ncbi:hypothetical protein [Oricola thermophila]|uniref:Uncharacterized protein n=1 Tax=Oricola thermophila TaxID=2742145 RepID=A0A6N1VBZ4_9HYPH|nr:hypothetical protein [Oricola thermophila]QKV18414.1 hypothetical protein HTY61_08080 [Oricola thermophila]
MIRFLGFLVLLTGLAASFGPGRIGLELPVADLQPMGGVLVAVGGVMLLFGGRRRRNRDAGSAGRVSKTSSIGYRRAAPKPEESKPGIVWGREGDND